MSVSLLVQAVEAKTFQSGKSGYLCKTPGQNYFVWDNSLARELAAHMGESVEVVVQSKGDFHSIKGFLGVSDSAASPGTAEGAAPPSPSSSRGGGERADAHGRRTNGSERAAFQKDPAGLQLSARQTSLNAAVAYAAVAGPGENIGSVISDAATLYQYLVQDLENVAAAPSAAKPAGSGAPAATPTWDRLTSPPTQEEIPF